MLLESHRRVWRSRQGDDGLYAGCLNGSSSFNNGVVGVGSNSGPPLGLLSTTMAPSSQQPAAAGNGAAVVVDVSKEGKLQAVCKAVRAAVCGGGGSVTRNQWLRTELTTYSQCNDLAGALLRVKEVKDASMMMNNNDTTTSSNGTTTGAVSAEQGLKHLLVHSSEEEMYKAALGSYELELAYMVVAHSQRDPGEYLLELQRFAAISDQHLRRHAIDLHLRRYDSAVRNLLVAGDEHFTEALALARQHKLTKLVIQLTQDKPDLHSAALIAAGEDLEIEGRHEDAALAFVAARDLERALRAYRLASQWRPALALAAQLGREPEKITAMATRLASDLADSQRHAEAAQITLEYLNDVPAAVRLLTEGGEWREAFRVAYARSHGELVESLIAPSAAAASVRILESVTDDISRVEKYWNRLKELRNKREVMAAALEASATHIDGGDDEDLLGGGGGFGNDDATSIAETMISGFSIYTQGTVLTQGTGMSTASLSTIGGRKATKKKKQKQGKSSKKIRQGSPEEEAQLAQHVLWLSPSPELCAEVGQLTEMLVMLGHERDAQVLQRKLKQLIDSQQEAANDILAHPPPGQGIDIPEELRLKVITTGVGGGGGGNTNSGGAPVVVSAAAWAALHALDSVAEAVAGPELQRKATEAEAKLKNVNWKWEVLREAAA